MFRHLSALIVLAALVGGCSTAVPNVSPTPSATAQQTASARPTVTPRPATDQPSLLPGPTSGPTASPTLTPATEPPTPAPAPTPTPSESLVVAESAIAAHLDALDRIATDHGGLRVAGLSGYDASVEYVAGQLDSLGYAVERRPFTFAFFDEAGPVSLSVGDSAWNGAEWLHAMLYSAPGNVAGVVETVSMDGGFAVGTAGCLPEDWSAFTPGRIALIASGPCFRRDQVVNAQDAGAIAVISLYPGWEQNQTRRPTLLSPDGITIPAIVAGQEPTLALLEAADAGGSAELALEVVADERTIDNVLAELPGTTDRVVMLGGHLDSALDGPGINDNGSGIATLLAIAEALRARLTSVATIRFAFWGAEEFGDLGSQLYVAGLSPSEIDRIDAYLNLDMVGSPNAARFVYQNELSPPGSSDLTEALLAALEDLGAPGEAFDAGPSSDHFAFEQAGIPIGGVFSGLAPLTEDQARLFGGLPNLPADPCYHLACDTRANVDTGSARLLGQAVATVLEELAY